MLEVKWQNTLFFNRRGLTSKKLQWDISSLQSAEQNHQMSSFSKNLQSNSADRWLHWGSSNSEKARWFEEWVNHHLLTPYIFAWSSWLIHTSTWLASSWGMSSSQTIHGWPHSRYSCDSSNKAPHLWTWHDCSVVNCNYRNVVVTCKLYVILSSSPCPFVT